MDDISINSDKEMEHRHVRAIMDVLRKHNFKVKDCKYTFGKSEIEFVGY
jgi:hypothetical protein